MAVPLEKSKKMIFWAMLAAGILHFLSVLVRYYQTEYFSIRGTTISVVLVSLAIAYKLQQKN